MRRTLSWVGGAAGALGVALMVANVVGDGAGGPLAFPLVIVGALLLLAAGTVQRQDG